MNLQNLMIMKTLKDLKEFSLDKKQMNQIEGGISKAEYCATLRIIAENNSLDEGAREGLSEGWTKAGC